MSKLVVLYPELNLYYRNPYNGLIKFLSEKELKVKDLEIYTVRELKLAVKDKKVLTKLMTLENKTFRLDEPNTTYLIFTNVIRAKTVPENVKLVTGNLKVNQEDGVGNIYYVKDDIYNPISNQRVLTALIKTGLINPKSKLISKLNNILNPKEFNGVTNINIDLYRDCLEYLLNNIDKAKQKSTIKLLNATIERFLDEKVEYFYSGSSAYVALNSAVRNNKMKVDNSLSYNGFKYLDKLFELFDISKNGYSNNYALNDIKSFIRGFISVMLADELGYFIQYPKTSENGNKILYINNETDILIDDVAKVLPHMEKYVGYLNTTRNIGLHPVLELYRNYSENTSKKIIDNLLKNKELSKSPILRIEYVFDHNTFVKSQLQYKVM